jgi:DNA repair ATPase RecN
MFVKEIAVQGYQSLYKVGLKLGRFTVIYGESDVGKSAFYRAVRALVTAETGDSFISKGENKVGVALRLGSGEKVVWVKRKGKSCEYKLDEKVWRRNKTLPLEISKVLQLTQLTVNGDKFYPNLRGQFDSLFLLFESPSKRARILGALISNILLRAVRKANIERNRNEADIRAVQELVETLERKEKFDWSDFLSKVKASQSVLGQVEKGLVVQKKVEILQDEREALDRLVKFSLEILPRKPFTDIEKLLSKYEKLDDLYGYYKRLDDEAGLLSRDIVRERAMLADIKKKLAELKKKMTITCPYCKKEFSSLEVSDGLD